MAVPLTRYLSKAGSYEGFDIVPKGIEWCSKHITPRYPNFKFSVADIYSKHYNHQGRFHAADYKFPYPDSSFDFVLLTSVFTHMLPDAVKNYITEISRVCKPGGRCLFTAFLLYKESRHLIASGKSPLQFKDGPQRSCMVVDPAFPEAAVALTEEFIKDSLDQVALTMEDPPLFGSWCGRPELTSYQDILVAQRR
jgi:SAM-dependent methyltransferase